MTEPSTTSVLTYALPAVVALFTWWFSTGLVLYAIRGTRPTRKRALVLSTLLAVLSLIGIAVTRDIQTPLAAYTAFLAALGVWGWNEVSFLLGHVTGPIKKDCPADAGPVRRTAYAVGTILYHELAIAAGGVAVYAASIGAENKIALWTYLVLWGMRITAKINIFLGVSNLTDEFLPDNLSYLKSYFGHAPVTPFFALSVTIGTVFAALLFHGAHGSAFKITGAMLTGSLLSLALIEHWLLVLPFKDSVLWKWALRSKSHRPSPEPANSVWGTRRVGG